MAPTNKITGTSGNDSLTGTVGADSISANAGDDTVLAGSGNDTVYGGDGNDSLSGDAGNDSVIGDAGNDTLSGGTGTNTLVGGDGDDLFIAGTGADKFDGGKGQDNIDYSGSTAGVVVNLDRGSLSGGYAADDTIGSGIDGAYGSAFGDTLTGFDGQGTNADDSYTNQFWGNGGNDLIYGMGGNDQLYGGADNDLIYGGTGDDLVSGDAGADTLYGEDGADSVWGGTGADALYGGAGRDTMSGGADNDSLYGGAEADSLSGDGGADQIAGGDGDDTLYGGSESDTLSGDAGADVLYGGDGADSLLGGDGNDTLTGGAGNDVLEGGAGADSLSGGDDADLFNVAVSQAAGDVIDGGEGGLDQDVLHLTGKDPYKITYSTANHENGHVDLYDASGKVTGGFDFRNIEKVITCFTPGTLIATAEGLIPVETLRPGLRVITRDNGLQVIRWVGRRDLTAEEMRERPQFRPVRIAAGAFGQGLPERDLIVSPQHRILRVDDRNRLLFDEREVLVAAKDLVNGRTITRMPSEPVSYLHILFDHHELIQSDGVWTESFQPGAYVLDGMERAQRDEILALFPALAQEDGISAYVTVRRALKHHEALLVGVR